MTLFVRPTSNEVEEFNIKFARKKFKLETVNGLIKMIETSDQDVKDEALRLGLIEL